jgi:hypothetical protein
MSKEFEFRRLNEAEARAAVTMFWEATAYARMTIAGWILQESPTKGELMTLAGNLKTAEDEVAALVAGRPSDGHALASAIKILPQPNHGTRKID